MERYNEALEILDKGVEEFPFYTDLLVLRSEVLSSLGKTRMPFWILKEVWNW